MDVLFKKNKPGGIVTHEEIAALRGKLTNHEFSRLLCCGEAAIPERTVARWVKGDRIPRGPAVALLRLVEQILNDGQVTREQVLAKAGYPVVVRSIDEIKKDF